MQKLVFHPLPSLAVFGLYLIFQGLFVLGQSAFDSQLENGWRRTTHGWEHADSLPIATHGPHLQPELRFPTLRVVSLENVDRAHRLVLPLALAGFMACIGPWLLMRWPTTDDGPRSNERT